MNNSDAHTSDPLEYFRARKRVTAGRNPVLPADFRAANEDDDGYDPYSDYMDALARSDTEPLEEDPWR